MSSNQSHSPIGQKWLEPGSVIEIIGVLILGGLFLYWDISRAMYLLTAFFAIGYSIKQKPQLPRDHRFFSWPIYGFVGAAVLALAYHGFPDRGMNMLFSRYFLLLIAIPLVGLYFSQYRSDRNIWIKFALPCLVLASYGLYEVYFLGLSRAEGGNNAVVFGLVSASLICIVISSYYKFQELRYGKLLYCLCLVAGVIAILLSGSRGSWIVLPVIIMGAFIFYMERASLIKRCSIATVAVLVFCAVSLMIPQVRGRIDNLVTIISPYVAGEQRSKFNSASYRIEAWKASWIMGNENKLLGVGPGSFRDELKIYVAENPELETLQKMKHAHNQYMQTYATMGGIGLAALLALLVSHCYLFSKYLVGRYPREVRSIALAGLLLVIGYMLFSITAVPFERKKHLLVYGFSSATLWGAMIGALRQFNENQKSDFSADTAIVE